jgi:hypothetical protein
VKKIPKYLLLAGIFIALLVLTLITRYRVEKVRLGENVPTSNSKSFSLFVPSPYELMRMSENKDIWPRRFSRQMPPSVTDLPIIYYAFQKVNPRDKREVDFFRALAMAANLEEWEAFKDIIAFKLQFKKSTSITPKNLFQWAKGDKCSLYAQEVVYRILQWEPKLLKEVRSYFENCDSNSFHSFWFKVLEDQKSEDLERLKNLQKQIQERREKLANESYEYFVLTQAFNVLDLRLAHEFKGSVLGN